MTGTPKNIKDAVRKALQEQNLILDEHSVFEMSLVIRDFVAQKFGAAMIKADEDEKLVEVLRELFERIVS